jgi:hypothetical protein
MLSKIIGKKEEKKKLPPETNPAWAFLDCPQCYLKSMSNHLSRKKEYHFELCKTCSIAMDRNRICEDC